MTSTTTTSQAPTRNATLLTVRQDPKAFRHAPEDLRADKAVVLEAVKKDGKALRFANRALKGDREVALEAIKQNCHALLHANEVYRGDREVMLEVVKQHGAMLGWASKELQSDRELVLTAVKQDWRALEHADTDLQADTEIVLEAVKQDARAFAHSKGREVRANLDIMFRVVRSDPQMLRRTSRNLLSVKELVLPAVMQDWKLIELAGEALRADADILLEALKQNEYAIHFAAPVLRARKDFMMQAVQLQWKAFEHASVALRADIDLITLAVKQNGRVLRWMSPGVRLSKEMYVLAIRKKCPVYFISSDIELGNVSGSAIAVQGEDAPIVSIIRLTQKQILNDNFRAQALLMSGETFVVHVETYSFLKRLLSGRPGPTLNDLAVALVAKLPAITQVQGVERVFLNFPRGGDGEALAVTPWDCELPLVDFLTD